MAHTSDPLFRSTFFEQATRDKYIQWATADFNAVSKPADTNYLTIASIRSMEKWEIDPALVDGVKVATAHTLVSSVAYLWPPLWRLYSVSIGAGAIEQP